MIALLNGQLIEKTVSQVILDVGGVGYRLLIPLSTYYALPDEGDVRLRVHTHVREDALLLFGFLTETEKDLFGLLLSVSGVGPKVALNILSHLPAADLQQALSQGNAKHLATVPGIGKKTAERLVLELREKVGPVQAVPGNAPLPAETAGDLREDALSALVNLGYKENLSRKALDGIDTAPDAPLEDILKQALKLLMR
ncbi:Holliday junction DNA helicase RuvA [Syntrophotalea carbinolica DSM 2380]|uniref:Holliday junction branch migration complex subunit RuvA n=1 Tax=Syntrophotalea carbinolica (strain DSM 2380 / NBRC 103641 / GraBd1) TaxID=338963 RepID=RUVA_SYNC1|nr:Holliday junction branch migration protein RuvA [Syntrophotalea carbinolica]Q3A231.1 RecName: Full=Holliday junction branch migration complex subunit RuvA [Syntrophotalea carbinolica DSM 2380]ABA89576.1 Holliday junction DNA helicase RuvA [Syntrophotalea carbinolica DSM 2380]